MGNITALAVRQQYEMSRHDAAALLEQLAGRVG